jgi:tripartite-type tricarboxylate transporter receptor subunit TctC
MFKARTSTDLVHVPYKGIGPALTDVVGGQVALMFTSLDSALAHLKSGKLKALGVTGAKRSPLLPEVPTMAEAGLQGFEVVAWGGVLAPTGTPHEVIASLNQQIRRALTQQEVAKRFLEFGAEPAPTSSEEFGRFIKSEIDKWAGVVKAAGVTID